MATSSPVWADFLTTYSDVILWICGGWIFLGFCIGLFHTFKGIIAWQQKRIKI